MIIMFNKHLNLHSPSSHRQSKPPSAYPGTGWHTPPWAWTTPAPFFQHTTVHSYLWPRSCSSPCHRTWDRYPRWSSCPQSSAAQPRISGIPFLRPPIPHRPLSLPTWISMSQCGVCSSAAWNMLCSTRQLLTLPSTALSAPVYLAVAPFAYSAQLSAIVHLVHRAQQTRVVLVLRDVTHHQRPLTRVQRDVLVSVLVPPVPARSLKQLHADLAVEEGLAVQTDRGSRRALYKWGDSEGPTGTAELDVGAALELFVLVEIHVHVVHVAHRFEELMMNACRDIATSMMSRRVSCGWRLQTRMVDGWIFGGARSFIADQFFSASLRFTFMGKPLQLHALCFVHIFWPFNINAFAASSCVAISMYPMPLDRFEYRSRMSLIDFTLPVNRN